MCTRDDTSVGLDADSMVIRDQSLRPVGMRIPNDIGHSESQVSFAVSVDQLEIPHSSGRFPHLLQTDASNEDSDRFEKGDISLQNDPGGSTTSDTASIHGIPSVDDGPTGPKYEQPSEHVSSRSTSSKASFIKPARFSLPLTQASSVHSDDQNDDRPVWADGASLEQLEENELHTPGSNSVISGAQESIYSTQEPATRVPRVEGQIARVEERDIQQYRGAINLLSQKYSSFDSVAAARARHNWSSRIVFYDSFDSGSTMAHNVYRGEPWARTMVPPTPQEFDRALKQNVPPDCHYRLILVEDLSPYLVDLLGATFCVPPNVFETHLCRSGYAAEDQPTSRIKSTWQSRSSAESYSSIGWHRPVIPIVPLTPRLRTELLSVSPVSESRTRPSVHRQGETAGPIVECPFGRIGAIDSPHKARLTTSTNIWRKWIDLCPSPGISCRNSKLEYPVGWEERATTWTNHYQGCKIIIVLLDPIPLVTYTALDMRILTNAEYAYRNDGKKDAGKKIRRAQSATADSSVEAEQCWKDLCDHPFVDFVTEDGSDWTYQDLLETIVANTPQQRSNEARRESEPRDDSAGAAAQDAGRKILRPIIRDEPKNSNLHLEYHQKLAALPIFECVQSRFPGTELEGSIFTQDAVAVYMESLKHPVSTLDRLDASLWWKKGKDEVYNPLHGLFDVVYEDTQNLMDIVDTSLRHIREGMLDEGLVQERVSFWKGLLRNLNLSLRDLQGDVSHFSSFWTGQRSPSRDLTNEVDNRLTESLRHVNDITESLHEEMQVVHAQRNITETESVSKLTELAFVFIPLTFAASLFSMQVNELAEGVPLYSFATVAIGFVLIAYAVRLAIRNAALRELRDEVFVRIREDHRLQRSEPIPTRTFLRWMGGRTAQHISLDGRITWEAVTKKACLVIFGTLLVIPIIILWRRNIDKGFSAAITVLLVLLDMFMVGTAFKSFGQPPDDWETRRRRVTVRPKPRSVEETKRVSDPELGRRGGKMPSRNTVTSTT